MISIKKDFANPPQKLTDLKQEEAIREAILLKNKHKFKASIYRKRTIEALEKLYHFKCAYCETDTSAGAPLQVEHFRPKAKVEGDATHEGYYWLAYEWSNLILGCSTCNNNKRNHFPIKGKRIFTPQLTTNGLPTTDYSSIESLIFQEEKALLLNPEIDVVEEHFIFLPDGKIKGLTERTEETIKILKLNREPLIYWRKKVVDDFLYEIKAILEDLLSEKITPSNCQYAVKQLFIRITNSQETTKQYARLGFFLFNKFDIFIANQLDTKQKEAVLRLFQMYLNKEL